MSGIERNNDSLGVKGGREKGRKVKKRGGVGEGWCEGMMGGTFRHNGMSQDARRQKVQFEGLTNFVENHGGDGILGGGPMVMPNFWIQSFSFQLSHQLGFHLRAYSSSTDSHGESRVRSNMYYCKRFTMWRWY